jgi:hypothetical protein
MEVQCPEFGTLDIACVQYNDVNFPYTVQKFVINAKIFLHLK